MNRLLITFGIIAGLIAAAMLDHHHHHFSCFQVLLKEEQYMAIRACW
ncbi:MAG: hypothetical protein IPJ13_01540 [Saprospiraceae bacterium]|nr:hypothetical protein [Saprospiraceae bacterium]